MRTGSPRNLWILLFAIGAVHGASVAWADVRLPRLISDDMVLQRDAKVALWGWAQPGEEVRITFHDQVQKTKTDSDGRWTTTLGPFAAGGPYEMTVTGRNRIVLQKVMVGDVWVASGQSNMEFPIKRIGAFGGVDNADRELAGANFEQIRLFTVPHTVAAQPRDDVAGSAWVPVTPNTVGSFSAVAYLFGREWHQRYNVPVGLIEASWGATVVEAWVSATGLEQIPDFRDAIASLPHVDLTAPNPSRNNVTVLFNGMIAPLTGFAIKGVLWYQGEADANRHRAAQYRTTFPTLIQDWRNHWNYELPFLFVQLAGYGANFAQPADYEWADLREAQSMALSLPKTGMASAVDIGDMGNMHPTDKQDLAHRLVLVGAKVANGETLVDSGPTFQSMQVDGNAIRIKFSNLGSGLLIKDNNGVLRGFEIKAAQGKFVWAQARQDGQDVLVMNPTIQQPVAVRYDWRNTPDGTLFNKEGLPALPFRTDAK